MDLNIVISGIIGLAPALALLFITLRKYDYPYVEKTLFDARRVFLLLAVGIVFGMIVGALYYTFGIVDFISLLLLPTGLAVFEEMFKFVVLNLRRFQQRFDTVFYGVSLGVGLASTFVLYHVYLSIRFSTLVSIGVWISLIIFSVTLTLIHGSTGALMGYGSAKGRPWSYFGEVMAIRIFLIIILLPVLGTLGEEWFRFASLVAALLISIIIFYYYIVKKIIPSALPEDIRRKKRIKSRQIMKRKD